LGKSKVLEYLPTLVLPIHIHFLFQEGIEIPLSPRETLRDHYLPATLLNVPQESLVIGVEAVGFSGRGQRCLWIQGAKVA
jgi:hypothetical protein